ncbi:exoribonuclease II [Aspergillus candidus]|uniref:Exoribonuclease complex, subunit Rrp44/Dis3 n=1 Tax=Aspergillus candidus TaxID=41067 RepID=A0A2I2F5T8_ASPCN|nr:exoribonuclease complex, subunit Rrp44/Dis3 [Aspergillus candidus]PLB36014.1 exoribonuclease complex, subunit Rrp44/Dis3 [Aspergillus candidus]
MSLALARNRIWHGAVGATRIPRPTASLYRACRVSPISRRGLALSLRRYADTEHKDWLLEAELQRLKSAEQIRIRNEFEENGDVREYLRKWQDMQSNSMDPIGGPGSIALGTSSPWVGNMISDPQKGPEPEDDAEEEDLSGFSDESEGTHDFLEPGDLVALSSTDNILSFAVYVRSVCQQQQFYTERGKWRIASTSTIDYVIKDFAPPELVARLTPYMPSAEAQMRTDMQTVIEGGVPRPVGASLLRMMNEFDAQAQVLYQANAARLDRIHEIVAEEDERSLLTLEELACKVMEVDEGTLDDVILYTVHRATSVNPFLIERDRSSAFANCYVVQPLSTAQILDRVVTWVRDHQEHLIRTVASKDDPRSMKGHPLQEFLEKARRIIRHSRQLRSPTVMAGVGPTAERFQPEKDNPMVYREIMGEGFTYTDRVIIKFLQLWTIPPKRMLSGPLQSAGSHIMRATGMYEGLELTSSSVVLLLQELGVFAPWENLNLLDQVLSLPGHGISTLSDIVRDDVEEAGKRYCAEGVTDKMQDARTDWGDMQVYCVDDVGAEEIDDGVSLERIPGSDDTFWIRIHVANPSAFFDHEDQIMQYAASRLQTFYGPERTYPIFPKSLSQKYFSLAPGCPTLTISAKMNFRGDVLETDIRNGTINNVKYVTHSKVRSLFEPVDDAPLSVLTVGGELPEKETPGRDISETLTSEDEETFHTLRKLMLGFRDRRVENGAIEFAVSSWTNVSIFGGDEPFAPYRVDDVTHARHFNGDPVIQMRMQQIDPHEVPDKTKQDLISTLMNLAGWVAGKWCADRNIPAMFSGTFYHPEYARVTSENIGEYSGHKAMQLAAPKGVAASYPLSHHPLGLTPYTKSTSPLRRYGDLLCHYQIESALRFEREHQRTFDYETDSSILPFSAQEVTDYIERTRSIQFKHRICESSSKQFWGCMLLFRAFYFHECDLPETWECLLRQPYAAGTTAEQGFSGVITSLGLKCQVTTPNLDEADLLSVVEARITGVDLARKLVIMEATRVVKGFERTGEWA